MCYGIEDLGEPWGRRPCRRASFWLASASGERQARPKAGSPAQCRPHFPWNVPGAGQRMALPHV